MSTSDNLISSNTKSLKTIDVDDVKTDVQYEPSKSVQVKVINDDVYDGKEVEIERETEEQTASSTQQLTEEEETAKLSLSSYEQDYAESAESESFRKEMDLALAHVRKLALFEKESLVNSICDTFASFNGKEPSINDISAIFGRIKQEFASEAIEDEMNEQCEEIEDEQDSDYHPNDDSFDYDFDQDINENDDLSSSDAEDSDYDPSDAEDIKQVAADLAEDVFDDLSEEEVEKEELEQISFEEEEAIISSKEFDAEYFEAIQCVVNAAKLEKGRIYAKISKKYETEFGDEVIEKAFEQFADFEFEQEASDKEENEQEEEEESVYEQLEQESAVESEEYRIEMEYALNNVRALAAKHKETFVDGVCDAFKSLNGFEPSASELSAVFKAIRVEFAEEAREEFLSDVEEEEQQAEEEEEEVVNVD